jgi:CheY-like chemotaxis protein
MVVDDEPDIVSMVRLILELDGFEVVSAFSGEEALEILDREHPDAMLLDIRLPGLDGWGVLEELKARRRLEDLPVVMISAHATPSTSEEAVEAGCRGFLGKPFDTDELVTTLQRAIADN